MDEKLLNALEVGKTLDSINRHKKLLLEQYVEDATFYYAGGRFIATGNLMALLHQLEMGSIVIDEDNMPVRLTDILEFSSKVKKHYQHATNEYLDRYNHVTSQIRNNSV
jgi:hypothetical protein